MEYKRTARVELRLTLEEKDMLVKRANQCDKTVAQYIRELCLKDTIVTKTDIQTVIELKRIGNNLNQIAKQINTIPQDDIIRNYMKDIDSILEQITLISKKIL